MRLILCNVSLITLLFFVISVRSEYQCTAGYDCISNQLCSNQPIECPIGSFCPGREGSARLCPSKYYCPNSSTAIECPKGSACLTASTEPQHCSFLAVCPAKSLKQRRFVYVAGELLFSVVVIASSLLFSIYSRKISRNISRSTTSPSPSISKYDVEMQNTHPVEKETKRSDMTISPKIDLKFHDINLVVKTKGASKNRTLLHSVSGEFHSGQVSAIMGPSGAGKTTLMSVLSGKVKATSGELYINGMPESIKKYRKLIGFVPQEDVMLRTLTVRQTLEHSARLRLPNDWSDAQKMELVTDVINLLGLSHVSNSKIGDEESRGLSGGERKRVNIGIELVADPHILFLDEPTTGLDSTTSKEVMGFLKQVATRGLTVIAVIHQPRYEIMEMFDTVLLLGKGGHTVFIGSTPDALEHFTDLGFECPAYCNPSDFFMDVISGKIESSMDSSIVNIIRSQGSADSSSASDFEENSDSSEFSTSNDEEVVEDDEQPVEHVHIETNLDKEQTSDNNNDNNDNNNKDIMNNEEQQQINKSVMISHQDLPSLWLMKSLEIQEKQDRNKSVDVTSERQRSETTTKEERKILKKKASRKTAGFFYQLYLYMRRSFIQQTQDIKGLALEIFYHVLAGVAMGSTGMSSEMYVPAIPLEFVQTCPAAIRERCLTQALNQDGMLSIGFFMTMVAGAAAAVASNRTFGEEKTVYYRESSRGISKLAYFCGKNLFDLFNIARNCFVLLSFFTLMTDPPGPFGQWFGSMYFLMFCSYGMGYLVSNLLPSDKAIVTSVVIAVAVSVTSGLSPRLNQIDDYGPLVFFWWISYNRWAAESMVLTVVKPYEENTRVKETINNTGYHFGNYGKDLGLMIVIGICWRIAAFLALVFKNRQKQK